MKDVAVPSIDPSAELPTKHTALPPKATTAALPQKTFTAASTKPFAAPTEEPSAAFSTEPSAAGEPPPGTADEAEAESDGDSPDDEYYGMPMPWKPSPLKGSTTTYKIFPRVILHDIHDKAGINDRLFVLTRMLAFATEVKAALGFPTPEQMLGHRHGDTAASNWTEYYVLRPKVHPIDAIRCAPGIEQVTIRKASELKKMPSWLMETLMDTQRPLCLRIQAKYSEIRVPKNETSDIQTLMERGARHMEVWTSGRVVKLLKQATRQNYILRRPYNVLHVRLGDKATPACSTPSYIVEKVEHMIAGNGEHGSHPWVVMSDGGDDFFQQLVEAGRKKHIKFITEKEMRPLHTLTDNYLRYTVLECIFGGAQLAMSNFKDHGKFCKFAPKHAVPTHLIGC